MREELTRVVVHGTLHVLGHDHPERRAAHALADVAPPGDPGPPARGAAARVSPWPGAALAAAAALAAIAAAADGALLAAEREEPRPAGLSPAGEERDRSRRTLAFTRLLAQLVIGVALGLTCARGGVTAGEALLAGAGALLLVLVTETAARAWGDGHGSTPCGSTSHRSCACSTCCSRR